MLNELEWKYHPPDEEVAPKYAEIRSAADAALAIVDAVGDWNFGAASEVSHETVGAAMRSFAQVLDDHTPVVPTTDGVEAIRSVRLARMAVNEAIVKIKSVTDRTYAGRTQNVVIRILDVARVEVLKARWWACSAIAIDHAARLEWEAGISE